MKAVILAGGMGTRIAEETHLRPKPMIEIGGQPILWHIMKIYAAHGVQDFVVCCGYKGYLIKEYFANFVLHRSDVTFDLSSGTMEVHERHVEPWRVTLVDTGENSGTGGRLRKVSPYLRNEDDFCFTYGDGVADINVTALIAKHRHSGLLATVTAAVPPGRFGALDIEGDRIRAFREKPRGDGGVVNAGFFVLQPSVLDLIDDEATAWEQAPVERLATAGQLGVYQHPGFWHPMDTLRDRTHLEQLWAEGRAPWKCW
ncbi:glucose-1-phosphate cytidylyltransferase [Inhella sp.]|uniref:glucose-1-phosphate cytidylyltransferase n=1 Tax=Inhella sp. TaxID=1921806 RepID=UPI0035AF0B8E